MKHFILTLISITIIFPFVEPSYSQVIQREVEYNLSSGLYDGTNLT